MEILSLVRKKRSKTLLRVLSREIGRWLDGDLESLPGLGIMTTAACFHESGKNSRQAHPLKIWPTWRLVGLLQCLSAILEM